LEEKEMPVIDIKATGEKINELRNRNGITVKDIQVFMGFASPYPVYKWINGKNLPTLDNLLALAELFGVKMDDIVVARKL
jgi:transcriptional regulator with XRE-family HTH domain